MRILLVNVTCRQGSTGKIVYDLYTEYRKAGHIVAVCYGRGAAIQALDIYKFTQDWEVYLHALKTRLTGWGNAGSWMATRRLIRYIEAFRPDVVHLHNIHGYYVDAYRLLAYLKRSGVRTIFTMHDEWIFTGKCGHPHSCERWLEGCGKCPQLREYPKSLFFDRTAQELSIKRELFRDFDNIVLTPVASWLADRAKQNQYLADKQVQVVHNGIDLDIFHPQETKELRIRLRLANEKVLLHVTPNFSDPHKGGKYVLDLARRLAGEPVKIIVVGANGTLEAVPSNVILVPHTENQQELAAYYSLADALIMTSEMECLPTVCLESICCGTPVIGFDRGGAKEVAPEGYGIFMEYGDMDGLEREVLKLLHGATVLYAKEDCIKFGHTRYSKQKMAEQYLSHILQMESL